MTIFGVRTRHFGIKAERILPAKTSQVFQLIDKESSESLVKRIRLIQLTMFTKHAVAASLAGISGRQSDASIHASSGREPAIGLEQGATATPLAVIWERVAAGHAGIGAIKRSIACSQECGG